MWNIFSFEYIFADVLKVYEDKQLTEAAVLRSFFKKGVFKRKLLCQSLFFNRKYGGLQLSDTLAQMVSCEFRKMFKNTFFAEHLQTTASELYKSCEHTLTL